MKKTRIILSLLALLVGAANANAQAAGTVKCTDGTSSKGGQGACSGHGGVAKADARTDAKAAKAEKAGDAKPAKADKAADAKPAKADKAADAKPAKAEKAAEAKPAKPEKAADTKPMKAEKAADAKPAKGANAKADGAPTATCTDGTKSYAKSHSGACSGHGGVKEWLDGTAKKP